MHSRKLTAASLWCSQEAHYNHGKTREKVIYPYRNASQVELGKDSLDYGSTSHQTHCLAADKAKVHPYPRWHDHLQTIDHTCSRIRAFAMYTASSLNCLGAPFAWQYLRPERTSAANCRTKSNVNLSHADHTPYIKGLPLMALSMPELDPNKLRGRCGCHVTGMSPAALPLAVLSYPVRLSHIVHVGRTGPPGRAPA